MINRGTAEGMEAGHVLAIQKAGARFQDRSQRGEITTVQLPGAMPDLISGAKIAIVDAMTGAFLAEFISAQQGLGFLMVLGNSSYDTPMLFAAVILTVLLGLLGFGAVSLAERRLLRWRSSR